MSKITALHLSDIHIGKSPTKTVDDFYITICRDLKDKNFKIDLVICSGDIIDARVRNKKGAFDRAVRFFRNLMERINKDRLYQERELTEADFLFVPGNHDVVRDADPEKRYSGYRYFLKQFYGEREKDIYRAGSNHLYVHRVFRDEKIAFIGLNSCMGEEKISPRDESWIDNLEFTSLDLEETVTERVRDYLKTSKREYDDYGEIEMKEMMTAFDELKDSIPDHDAYRIVTFFHHHIYPFPEIYNEYGDSSMIRNFSPVINCLIQNNTRFVLHGHKHIPVSRLVTTNKYFENTQKSLYVFSPGTLESDGQRCFQVAEIFSPNEIMEAEIHKFNYSMEELQLVDDIAVPPQTTAVHPVKGKLHEIAMQKNLELYDRFKRKIESNDNTSYKYHIDNIVEGVEKIILNFEIIQKDLSRNPELVLAILCAVHYRINFCDKTYRNGANDAMLQAIGRFMAVDLDFGDEYVSWLEEILSSEDKSRFNSTFKRTFENNAFNDRKKTTSYVTIAAFITDLFLVISDFGETYFEKEHISNKINIKLTANEFGNKIPNDSIQIAGDEDRRSAIISFVCKDPTVHKVSVLIVKDFEERISQIEDAFKFLNLKLYYVRPKVQKDGYDMDNYNFEAYIPTLLPLLTGDNLYSQKEVFVRELIQNSFDAIRLREKLEKRTLDTKIRIQIGRDETRKKRFLRITDEGVGMDLYKIERYFTSIGRSFYRSNDFEELQKENSFRYKALSNFGIGFLSVFMVCEEVVVRTRSREMDTGVNIHIPNYEGCFFIRKDDTIDRIGTEITIYEDERKRLDTKNIRKYLQENFLDFPYDIAMSYPKNKIEIKAHSIRRKITGPYIFVPFENEQVVFLKEEELADDLLERYEYGYFIGIKNIFQRENIYLNEGIRISSCEIDAIDSFGLSGVFNFQSSMIILDVSRDNIIGFGATESFRPDHKINSEKAEEFIRDLRKAVVSQVDFFIKKLQSQNASFYEINRMYMIDHMYLESNITQAYSVYIYLTPEGTFETGVCKYNNKEISQKQDTCVILNQDGTIQWKKKCIKFISFIAQHIIGENPPVDYTEIINKERLMSPKFFNIFKQPTLFVDEKSNLILNLTKKYAEIFQKEENSSKYYSTGINWKEIGNTSFDLDDFPIYNHRYDFLDKLLSEIFFSVLVHTHYNDLKS